MGLTPQTRNRLYGAPGKVPRVWVTLPWGMRVQAHQAVAGLFLDACRDADRECSWKPRRCDGYVNRPIRGSYNPSLHAYALAWDFFATSPGVPPPGGVWTPHNGMPHAFAEPFRRRGFTWGAGWKRADVPHIEWAQAPPGGRIIVVTDPTPPPARPAPRGGFLMALSDAQQGELYNLARNDHEALQALRVKVDHLEAHLTAAHDADVRHRYELRDTLATLARSHHDASVKMAYELRDTLAALTRRLFGVDEKKKNDDEPFWKKK